jgi:hypothetical protein
MDEKKQKDAENAAPAEAAPDSKLFSDLIADRVLCRMLGHNSPRTLRRWFSKGRGPAAVRIGKRLFYRKSSVEKWLAAAEQQPRARRRAA